MPEIKSSGDPHSDVWIICERPFSTDIEKGVLFSGGYGYVFRKMLSDAKFFDNEYYITCRKPDPLDTNSARIIENDLNHYKPKIIITIEETGKFLCSELEKTGKILGRSKLSPDSLEALSDIEKYCGSLLTSPKLKYEHYVIPTFSPEYVSQNWKQRDIITSFDLGKAHSELEYYRENGKLQPYKARTLVTETEDFDYLLSVIENFTSKPGSIISNDIETVYPHTDSMFIGHPGSFISVGLANSDNFGISFDLFRKSNKETIKLWRCLHKLFEQTIQLGQNFLIFDIHRYQMLGFKINKEQCHDTLIRQHILYPELPKSLQFMTRQYTRQPYYKDEGKGWTMKDIKKLRHYNCLDVTVTYEIYNKQEVFLKERGLL
jgi:uracil-DNA glycosylase